MNERETFVADVRRFAELAGCTTDQFNARQTALYIGLQLEEMAEKLEAIFGCRDMMVRLLISVSSLFKRGDYDSDVAKANRECLLDADIDLAWVTVGSALSQGADVLGALREVARANLDKINVGVVKKDANGKVIKPAGWRGPDMSQFINRG